MAMMMMMDGQQEPPVAQLSSTYPSAPMEYVNMYTNENVKNGKAPVPPKIIKENYSSFGKFIDPNEVLILSLENQGIERLYSLAQLPTPPLSSDESSTATTTTTKPQPAIKSEKEEISEPSAQPTTTTNSSSTAAADDTTATVNTTAAATATATDAKPKQSLICNYPINTNNHKRELKKLNHSILVAYLDLLDILVHAPNTQIEIEAPKPPPPPPNDPLAIPTAAAGLQQEDETPNVILKTVREQKLGDLEILFINMHHLINELRPHQARDTLRCILEMQRRQRFEMAAKFKDHLTKIVHLLHNCIKTIEPKSDRDPSDELSTLLSNAKELSKTLEELSDQKSRSTATTTITTSLQERNQQTNKQIAAKKPPIAEVTPKTAATSASAAASSNGFSGRFLDDEDVEMKSFEDHEDEEKSRRRSASPVRFDLDVHQMSSKKREYENVVVDDQDGSGGVGAGADAAVDTSNLGFVDLNLKNCDIRDLILCDLIDDEFKMIENEY